ncbi:facilitated trehalose transporter Tret1-like isoform X2 [Agrilus planipennis]|uniref:Facilitated trehalose transporter Tret1-like isoform X2 n=1 Tax=Agrilus planipennis TaxID=224129 RepID=A0A1W4XAL9_AGRPL|nr:facilitated trehalose transporter Tret1-like isoform X2 [Agrilus planipennis]
MFQTNPNPVAIPTEPAVVVNNVENKNKYFWSTVFVRDISGAEKSLMKLRGLTATEVEVELRTIINEIENERQKGKTIKQLFQSRPVRKSLVMTLCLVAFQQLSGVEVVRLNMYSTFTTINSKLSETTFGIITGGIQVVASTIPPLIVDRYGRKLLLFVSGMGIIVGNAFLGIYHYAIEHDVYVIRRWIPIASLTLFEFAFNLGYGPLPWTIMGEVFYATIRPLAAMITTMFCYIIGFSVSFVTPVLTSELGTGNTFWIFSIFGFIGAFFTELYMFETKQKSLGDIQDELNQ